MNRTAAEMTLANYYAKQAIKDRMRRAGLKPQYEVIDPAEVRAYRDAHLEELIERARPVLASMAKPKARK